MSDDPRYREDDDSAPPPYDPGLSLAARLGGLDDENPNEEAPPQYREPSREERRLQQQQIAASAPPFEGGGSAVSLGDSPLARPLIIVLVLACLGVIGVFAYPYLFKKDGSAPADVKPSTGTSGSSEQAGALVEVLIDDAFRSDVISHIEQGNAAWKAAGSDAEAYRYSVVNVIDPGKTQRLTLRIFVGGGDADKVIEAPGDEPFRTAMQPLMDRFAANQGVEPLIMLRSTGGKEMPEPDSVYVNYGYYYGVEHWDDIKPIVEALEAYRASEGQYPHALDPNLTSDRIKTKGGFFFDSEGFGYLPLFRTAGDGSIQMGSGTGIERYNPEECTDYYLFVYLKSTAEGLDMHDEEALNYYREKISPFPYQAPKGIKNVALNPDGEPDGIACVVKNGELLR